MRRFPKEQFTLLNDSTILCKSNAHDFRIFTDNAYIAYRDEPDSLPSVFDMYINASNDLFCPRSPIDIHRIIPTIKSIEYLTKIQDLTREMGATKKTDFVYEKYNDQLIIIYAEDNENSVQTLTHKDLENLSLNKDSLRVIATRNLDSLLTKIEKRGENGTYMITAGGNYEASIILLKYIFTKKNLLVNGDYVIAIPTRDILLVTGSKNQKGLNNIRKTAKEIFETGNYLVSQYLFKWDGNKFEPFGRFE